MPRLHLPLAPGMSGRRTALLGLALLVLLAGLGAWRAYPPLPRVLRLQIVFPEGSAERTEPLIASGSFEAGDFLDVRYASATTARFGYDYWGFGGPVSEAFALEPGRSHALEIELPAFAATGSTPRGDRAPVRVTLDGRELLRADVPFHQRAAQDIHFAENPIGGTTGGLKFRGQLRLDDGRELRGGPAAYFTAGRRLATWLTEAPGAVVFLGLASAGLAFGLPWLLAWLRQQASHRWFLGTAAVCAGAFVWVLTGNTWRLIAPESFANFYDYQAASLLQGRLDVPEEALSGEAFWFDGKCYGYFGPTPALLRLPFALFGVGFGQLSRAFLVLDYLAALAAAYALLGYAVRRLGNADNAPSRFTTVAFTAAAGLGSTLFFVASRAYIYHEAIACGVAFALWSAYAALRFLDAPASRWWIGALLCGTAAVQARAPIGFFALSLLGVVAATHLLRPRMARAAWKRPVAIGALAAAAVASYNGLSYLKFKTIDGCPVRYNVQYSPKRLARIDGRQFHWSNLRYTFDAYFRKVTLGANSDFPYFHMKGINPRGYAAAKIDLAEPMAGVPYAMPALFGLSLLALAWGAFAQPGLRLPLLLLFVAAVPMSLAMFAAIAVSHRYTADFLGLFVPAAAFGIAGLGSVAPRWRIAAHAALALLVAGSACITLALTLNFQGTIVWGQPKETLEHYRHLREQAERATRWLHGS